MLGPNGAGKSTLAALLCAREWPTQGQVIVFGIPYRGNEVNVLRNRLGIFQPALQDHLPVYHPAMTAEEVILTGLDGSLAIYQEFSSMERQKVQKLYKNLFPAHDQSFPLDRSYRKLSSGEKRRVLLMRCFIQSPEFVLLDEPYESLDIPARISLEKALQNYLHLNTIPSLTILHRIEEIPEFATHILMLKEGYLFQAGQISNTLNDRTLSDLYATRLRVGRDGGRYYCVPL